MGGVGKTEFVSKCIESFISEKDKIIWFECTEESKFATFIDMAGYGYVLKGENKTDLSIYSGFKDLIEKDKKIIFWDNFQSLTDKTFSDFILFVNKYSNLVKIIILTKVEPKLADVIFNRILIEGLSNGDALEFARKVNSTYINSSNTSEADLSKICCQTQGHPLSIQLAIQLVQYGLTSDSIIQSIVQYKNTQEIEQLSNRLFLDVFHHPSTSIDERDLLLKFSIFKEKIPKTAIDEIFEGDSFIPLKKLMDKLLISKYGNYYETHPLIREFCYELNLDKVETHTVAAHYYISRRENLFDANLETQIYYHLAKSSQWETMAKEAEDKGRQYIIGGQLSLLKEILDNLSKENIFLPIFNILYGDIQQILGNWDDAKIYFDLASKDDNNKKVKVEGLIKSGEIIFRKGRYKEAKDIFEKARTISEQNSFQKELARALNDIALVQMRQNEPEARKNLTLALKIREQILDYSGITDSYNNFGVLYYKKGKYRLALQNYLKTLKIAEQENSPGGIVLALNGIALTMKELGENTSCMENLQRGKTICEQIGDKQFLASTLNSMGSVIDNFNEKLSAFSESYGIYTVIGDKYGLSISNANLGHTQLNLNNYKVAFSHFLNSIGISIQLEISYQYIMEYFTTARNKINDIQEFRRLVKSSFEELEAEYKPLIPLSEICFEPISGQTKIGRNEPCSCGSGKKYKNCHGANI